MTVKVKRAPDTKKTLLRNIGLGDGFVDEDGWLFIRNHKTDADLDGPRLTSTRCLCYRLAPTVGHVWLLSNLEVYPANINIEWELS